jgi:hypothetical protein
MVNPRNLALSMVYESVKHRLTVGLEQYVEAVKDWDVIPLEQDGQVIGGVLVKENEMHVGYGVKPKGTVRAHMRAILEPVIDQYGFIKTKVSIENVSGLEFCYRLGLTKYAETNGQILLKCNRSDYAYRKQI